MKTNLMIIGILFLISSCDCFKIKNDVRRVWSFKFNQCRCQWYSFKEIKNLSKLIPCEDFFESIRKENEEKCRDEDFKTNNPEKCFVLSNKEYCDDLVGFSMKAWALNITPHGRESKACFEDTCD